MTSEIYKRIWELSPYVSSSEAYLELSELTRQLIDLFDQEERLSSDPFNPTRERTLSLPMPDLEKELTDSTCLVTGGLGCVGSLLVNELLKYNVKKVIVFDCRTTDQFKNTERVTLVHGDVRDAEQVHQLFSAYRPEFVFHTAAERDPGFSEAHVAITVRTNVFGTMNVVNACEASASVRKMIFSSTGKASRYFTEEVYAATKKVCEFIIDTYARSGRVKYAMVRFTHILDNSLMNIELENASKNKSYLSIHSPGKYVTAQNAHEAAYLMLNALVYAQAGQCQFLLVRHLEWPVESLEMALYHIKQSGRAIPLIFLGNPMGYSEKFFRGQMDWSRPNDLNLLINVYERKWRKLNPANDIILSQPCVVDRFVLNEALVKMQQAEGETQTKAALIEGLKDMVMASLERVDRNETVSILRWGLESRFLEMENAQPSDFGAIIPMMIQSLEGHEEFKEIEDLIYYQHL